jgi:hypothetical protein
LKSCAGAGARDHWIGTDASRRPERDHRTGNITARQAGSDIPRPTKRRSSTCEASSPASHTGQAGSDRNHRRRKNPNLVVLEDDPASHIPDIETWTYLNDGGGYSSTLTSARFRAGTDRIGRPVLHLRVPIAIWTERRSSVDSDANAAERLRPEAGAAWLRQFPC